MLVRLSLSDTTIKREERFLEAKLSRIRDVRVGPDGLIYLVTDDLAGANVSLSAHGRRGIRITFWSRKSLAQNPVSVKPPQ